MIGTFGPSQRWRQDIHIVVRWNSLTQAAVKVRPFFWKSHSLNLQQEWEWSEKIEKKLAEKTVCLSCFCVCSGLKGCSEWHSKTAGREGGSAVRAEEFLLTHHQDAVFEAQTDLL